MVELLSRAAWYDKREMMTQQEKDQRGQAYYYFFLALLIPLAVAILAWIF